MQTPAAPIPVGALETVFLDVGNTLIGMDFELMAEHLARCGAEVAPRALERAEAAARPLVSASVQRTGSTETLDVFPLYLRTALAHLPPESGTHDRLDRLAHDLAAALRRLPTERLWSRALPGAAAALGQLRARGLTLVAVSNSNGTAERSLQLCGLREPLAGVVDSHLVGFEKPDPRIFALALERHGARAATTVHTGDLYHVDVLGARRAGLHAVLVDPYGDWPEDLDCARVAGIHALPELLAPTADAAG